MKQYKLFINGEWVESVGGKSVEVLSPSTGEAVAAIQDGNEADAQNALEAAEKAQLAWKKIPARQRADLLRAFTAEIRANRERLAQLLTSEQDKLLTVARFEVDVTCSFIEYACNRARQMDGTWARKSTRPRWSI